MFYMETTNMLYSSVHEGLLLIDLLVDHKFSYWF